MNNAHIGSEPLSELKAQGIILGTVFSYQSLSAAQSAAYEHSVKYARIVMGECPWYWVVSPADAERLLRAGYEVIG